MVCCYDPNGLPTICENIANWQHFSRFQIEVINLWPARGAALQLPQSLDLTQFAGVVIHCTASYSPINLFALDEQLEKPFEEFHGLKILMKQDEQVLTNLLVEYIGRKGIDIVITCVSPGELEKVYPRNLIGDVDFIHAWAGYVSPSLRSLRRQPISERRADIAYRGSIQPLEFGRLGYEKRGIGYDIEAATRNVDLRTDISSRWEDRINGPAWFDFLCQSKVVLGAESGSNLFDLTGEVAAWCRAYENRHHALDSHSKDFYLRAHEEYLHRFEGNVNYATISPRHLEAAASCSAQLLYKGDYSGILLPHRHYFPLERDLSNIEDALDFVRDDRRLKVITDCAYEEIVGNPEYHYEHFVEMFDSAVEKRKQLKQRCGSRQVDRSDGSPNKALLLVPHEPKDDPRIDWFAEGLAADFEVCEVGIHDAADVFGPSVERISRRRTRVRVDAQHVHWDSLMPVGGAFCKNSPGLSTIERLFIVSQLPTRSLRNTIGALDATEEDVARFRGQCKFFLNTNLALLEASRLIGGFELIVAADLYSLPAAVALAEESGVPLVYDAHEYWPYAVPWWRHWETEFFSDLERTLLQRVTLPLTVSPHLATIMSQQYGSAFDYIPNCAPLGSEEAIDLEASLETRAQSENVIFLVQGAFAPQRGFEKLINAWDKVDSHAKLWLRGPDNPEKKAMIELAESKGLLDQSVFFPEPVPVSDLVKAAREADIGLIPYEPTCLNSRYCSPNKLSQYMAAGLPILCNELDFVKSVVVDNGVGAAVDFRDEAALVRSVNEFVRQRELIPILSRRSQRLFKTEFNWQSASQRVYSHINKLVSRDRRSEVGFSFGWLNDSPNRSVPREPSMYRGREGEILSQDWAREREFLSPHEAREQELDNTNLRLNDDIESVYIPEIERLNRVYSQEIKRLNKVYSQEIERLQKSLQKSSYTNSLGKAAKIGLRAVLHPVRAISKVFR
jgi:glycosyltransferase involved in cell wall biosynthesis